MAEIGIVLLGLGSFYIMSKQENNNKSLNCKENFVENSSNKKPITQQKSIADKKSIMKKNTKEAFSNMNNFTSLTGNSINVDTFKHNNMQPYFGAKIRGATTGSNNTESILDNKLGVGSQQFSKSEIAPLFKPDENYNHINGMPINTDFIQSRMNESNKMSNVTLWEPQRVGPNDTKNKENGLDGFNNGMSNRNDWKPKNVDDLRTSNNPKTSYDLNGHNGPAYSYIQNSSTTQHMGNVEKYLPDTYYESGPNRWFTTTNDEKKPTVRSKQLMPYENRGDTTREYYGSANSNQAKATYTEKEYEESKRQNLGNLPISNLSATGQYGASKNSNFVDSYNILPNNRTTDKDPINFGHIHGIAKAVISPLMDILNPTRKENVIGNSRINGNVNSGNYGGHIFNERDTTKVTNREMTTNKIGMNYSNIQNQSENNNGLTVAQYQTIQNQRTSTNKEFVGNPSSKNHGTRTYEAAYNQKNNVNKTYEIHNNPGNMSLFNNSNNVQIVKNENMLKQTRNLLPNGGPNMIPSSEFMGELNGIQTYDYNYNSNRMDESLLDAFKSNPYTKSLTSAA
tara:strand:- start:1826 stop:3529 length:1704 start_codon:yes stop_codon:yes gene_type:complete